MHNHLACIKKNTHYMFFGVLFFLLNLTYVQQAQSAIDPTADQIDFFLKQMQENVAKAKDDYIDFKLEPRPYLAKGISSGFLAPAVMTGMGTSWIMSHLPQGVCNLFYTNLLVGTFLGLPLSVILSPISIPVGIAVEHSEFKKEKEALRQEFSKSKEELSVIWQQLWNLDESNRQEAIQPWLENIQKMHQYFGAESTNHKLQDFLGDQVPFDKTLSMLLQSMLQSSVMTNINAEQFEETYQKYSSKNELFQNKALLLIYVYLINENLIQFPSPNQDDLKSFEKWTYLYAFKI